MSRPLEKTCLECGSPFFAAASAMSGLCAACAHVLYGYPACPHEFVSGQCKRCGWNGAVSAYLASRTGQTPSKP